VIKRTCTSMHWKFLIVLQACCIASSGNYGKQLWQTINNLLHWKALRSHPSTISEPFLPSTFSSFFTDKITKLYSSLTSKNNAMFIPHSDPPCTPQSFNSSRLVTTDEILKLINQSPDKQCDHDALPTSFFAQALCSHFSFSHYQYCQSIYILR